MLKSARGSKRWVQVLSLISVIFLVMVIISYDKASDVMLSEMDPERNHLLKLEAGEQGTVNFETPGIYTALRISEDGGDRGAELRLIDSEGEEINGRSPNSLEIARPGSDGETIYVPVRVFEEFSSGEHRLYNDGEDTLWLVNDLESQMSMMESGWVIIFMIGCCFGSITGLIALILAANLLRKRNEPIVKGVTIPEGRIPTTDEIYRQYHSLEESLLDEDNSKTTVPSPFISSSEEETHIVENTEDSKIATMEIESDDGAEEADWRGWDEG